MTDFASLVDQIETPSFIEATNKQRAYMVVLVFSRKVPDHVTELVLNVYNKKDLPRDRVSEIISTLVNTEVLSAKDARDRHNTFSREQKSIYASMSDVLGGKPWPDDIPFD